MQSHYPSCPEAAYTPPRLRGLPRTHRTAAHPQPLAFLRPGGLAASSKRSPTRRVLPYPHRARHLPGQRRCHHRRGSAPTPHGLERDLTIIELGAGTATKTGLLLRAAVRRQGTVTYHARSTSRSPRCDEATRQPDLPPYPASPSAARRRLHPRASARSLPTAHARLVLYIGSSLGNFEPTARRAAAQRPQPAPPRRHAAARRGPAPRHPHPLAAYDDAARRHRRLQPQCARAHQSRPRRRLRSHEVPPQGAWNGAHSRIEMHLESLLAHEVAIPSLDLTVAFRRGETIHTENSYKFTIEGTDNCWHRPASPSSSIGPTPAVGSASSSPASTGTIL